MRSKPGSWNVRATYTYGRDSSCSISMSPTVQDFPRGMCDCRCTLRLPSAPGAYGDCARAEWNVHGRINTRAAIGEVQLGVRRWAIMGQSPKGTAENRNANAPNLPDATRPGNPGQGCRRTDTHLLIQRWLLTAGFVAVLVGHDWGSRAHSASTIPNRGRRDATLVLANNEG